MMNRYVLYAIVLSLVFFSGCATTDLNYADRNNLDTARARCEELARTSGYREIITDSVGRDGQSEWKVGFLANKNGKDHKERCEYNAVTDRTHMED